MREQFEELPDIKWIIANFYFDADCNNYKRATSGFGYDAVAWLNGAYYAFQEQQKIIDRLNSDLEILEAGEDY